MNIQLTKRELELILVLIETATQGHFSFDSGGIMTEEEEALVSKLNTALLKYEKIKNQ